MWLVADFIAVKLRFIIVRIDYMLSLFQFLD